MIFPPVLTHRIRLEDGMGKKPLNMMDMGVRPKEEDKVGQMPIEKTMMERVETSKNMRRGKSFFFFFLNLQKFKKNIF